MQVAIGTLLVFGAFPALMGALIALAYRILTNRERKDYGAKRRN